MFGHLKVTGLILGMQCGYTKFCCFLREWDSRAKGKYCKIKVSSCDETEFQGKSVSEINGYLTKKRFFLPPMHIAVFLNFLGNIKAEKCEELLRGPVQRTPGCEELCHWIVVFFTVPLGLLPSETERKERGTWGKVSTRLFPQLKKNMHKSGHRTC